MYFPHTRLLTSHHIKTHLTIHCFPRSSPSSLLPPCFLLAHHRRTLEAHLGTPPRPPAPAGVRTKTMMLPAPWPRLPRRPPPPTPRRYVLRIRRVRACSRMYVICVFSCGKHIVGGCAHENTSEVGSRDVRRTGIGWVVHNRVNVVLGTHPANKLHRGARRYLALASSTRLCLLVFPPSSPPRPGSKRSAKYA